MKRWIVLCAVLALVQTGLTVVTHLSGRSGAAVVAKGPLLPLQNSAINGLLLEDDKGGQLQLTKAGSQWLLPASGNFPADSSRVQELLDKLINLQRGWPEATTAEAATRFHVADNAYAHKLTLLQDGTATATIYFGTSPGLRKLYVRVDKDAEIHSLALTAQDLTTRADNWIDTTLLSLKPEQITRVHLPGIDLERTEDGLHLVGLQEDEELVQERLHALVNRIAHLSITNILGQEEKTEYGLETPALQYRVELEGGATIHYTFGQSPQPATIDEQSADKEGMPPVTDNSVVLRVSNQKQLLRVEGWQVDELQKATRASLVKNKTSTTSPQQVVEHDAPPSTPPPASGQ